MRKVIYEKQNHVAVITLNQPERLNVFNTESIQDLIEALEFAKQDQEIRCIILRGAGEKAFSAGGDIKEEIETDSLKAYTFGQLGKQCVKKVQDSPVPVIAAVHGHTLGGGMELVLAADITIAAENTKIGMPTIKLGTIPGWGSTKTLADAVGKSKAKELLYTGRILSAKEAYSFGLVEKVVPTESLFEEAMHLAEEIADKAPIAIRAMKHCIDKGQECDRNTAYAIETGMFSLCYGTQDKREAMQAFLEKREHEPYQGK